MREGLTFAKFWIPKATFTVVPQAYPHAVAFSFVDSLIVSFCMENIESLWSVLFSGASVAGEELKDALV